MGRGVLASSLQNLRVNLSPLQSQYPDMARSFVELQSQLDSRSFQSSPANRGTHTSSEAEVEADRRHQASNQMPLLPEKIRAKPGSERFLLPPSEAEIQDAAAKGPIVILNASICRCDALIVEKSAIRLLELSHLSQEKIHERAQDVKSIETLE